jgi:hypothetical protein
MDTDADRLDYRSSTHWMVSDFQVLMVSSRL